MWGWSASGSAFTRGVVNGSGGGHPRNVMESDLSNEQNIFIQHHLTNKFSLSLKLKKAD